MSEPAENLLLKSALAYAERLQWPVFPVYGIGADGRCTCGKGDCSRPGKHPIGRAAPRGLHDASRDGAQIARWWADDPLANIGIPTGAVSGLVALDVDTGKGGEDGLYALQQQHLRLPETVMALTGGGGYHYLFTHPGAGIKVRNSVVKLGEGLDIRGDGGYIIVAPSLHASGRRYEWEASCHPVGLQPAPLPAWLLALTQDAPRPSTPPPGPTGGHQRLYPNEFARIRAALAFISPEGYDDWLQVGMALHSTGDDRAFGLWCAWAKQSAKFDAADHARRWASFTRSGVTLGSLFATAKAGGYTPPGPPPAPPPPDDPAELSPPDDPDDDWERLLYRNGKGEVITSPANLETLFRFHPSWMDLLAWDDMSYRTVKRRAPPYPGGEVGEWGDADDTWAAIWAERHYTVRPRNTAVASVAAATARLRRFHQVVDWLTALPPHDGVPRLPTFFSDFCGAAFDPYTEAVGRAFFVSAVARVMRPGCKVDTMLVLEGPQGCGKSRLILTLFSAQWHIEISYEPGSLDFYQALRGTWCAEFGEMASFDRAGEARIKQVLTQTQDTYRASYGHHAGTYPRQTVFVGSTNKREWGSDETGMRRFLPVYCPIIDIDAVAAIRDQLWAEALARYNAGEVWWQIPNAEKEQEARFNYDAWEEKIANWIERRQLPNLPLTFTVNDVYEGAIHGDLSRMIPPISRADQTRIGKVLTRLGWQTQRITRNGKRSYLYERTKSDDAA